MSALVGQVRRRADFDDEDPEDILLELSDYDRSLLDMKPNQLTADEKYVANSTPRRLDLHPGDDSSPALPTSAEPFANASHLTVVKVQ
jgi:hypothetical protein